jgi:hypothetical protein
MPPQVGRPRHSSAQLHGSVWAIDEPTLLRVRASDRRKHVEQAKLEILRLVASTSTAVIVHPDPPAEHVLPGTWTPTPVSRGSFVPSDLDLTDDVLTHWLFALGNWTVFSNSHVPKRYPDLFRSPVSGSLAWMDDSGHDVVIDSFHDDMAWVIALRAIPPAA